MKIVIASGFRLAFLKAFNFDGFTTLWGEIWMRPDLDRAGYETVLKHEGVHVAQMARLGKSRFMIEYTWQLFLHGYRYNKFEIEARQKAGQEI